MRSWLIIVGMRRPKSGKSMRVINYTLKIVYLRCIFGLNTSIKLNEMRIDAIVVFFALIGRLKRLFTKLLLAGG